MSTDAKQISQKPFLIRAIYDWVLENGNTPYIQIDTCYPGTQIPEYLQEQPTLILNISPKSCKNLIINNEFIKFSARFNSNFYDVYFLINAVLAVFAHEIGDGLSFAPVSAMEKEQDGLLQKKYAPTNKSSTTLKLLK